MDRPEYRQIKELLTRERLLSLAVLVEGAPLVGLLPFVVTPDLGAAIVHASRLARHTKGLAPAAPFGLLVHAAEAADGDPRQVPRLSLEGEVEPLAEGSADWDEARGLYLARFPASEPIFALPDFGLYALRFRGGRFVGGFAAALNVSADTLAKAARA